MSFSFFFSSVYLTCNWSFKKKHHDKNNFFFNNNNNNTSARSTRISRAALYVSLVLAQLDSILLLYLHSCLNQSNYLDILIILRHKRTKTSLYFIIISLAGARIVIVSREREKTTAENN